jgi:hypothetical protein
MNAKRWFLGGALALGLVACDDTLGPVFTLDGYWSGTTPGYQVSVTLTQKDTVVTGTGIVLGGAGSAQFNVNGKMVSRQITLTLTNPAFTPTEFTGTLSTTEAVIDGRLNGSGFENVSITMKKR